MEWSVYDAADWLQQHIDEEVHVIKQEQDDTDEIRLRLRDVGVTMFGIPDADDYVEQQALVLYGEGTTLGNGQAVRLPVDEFEIPVTGPWVCTPDGEQQLAIETDRARYRIVLH
jgi:hypothetical protein